MYGEQYLTNYKDIKDPIRRQFILWMEQGLTENVAKNVVKMLLSANDANVAEILIISINIFRCLLC